ncbi:probable carboxylesterase 120 [Arachis stenosperma]|uniref:probable carboxylesterase 120 n=1 Tax=Arachis stenosperma TaxID=217475 RepID=UPI0025ABD1C8|nr:probable carboxylesterase 120 [Arachis stenosperma]
MSHPLSKSASSPLNSNSTIDDPLKNLGIVRNQDGTITRIIQYPTTPPTQDLINPILTKDLPLNPKNKTWVRIFLPKKALQNQNISTKLPLIVYYHGGGFIYTSASSTINHDFCSNMSLQLSAVIASVDYRLAPEYRLPAAYDDSVEALHWLRTTDETWVRDYADFSKCYIMGSSAGGNIAYHVGLLVSTTVNSFDFDPLKIRGLILHHPFFGGSQRTESELRPVNDPVLPIGNCDLMWELALPEGAGRDHWYCNPTVVDDDVCFEEIKRLRWKVFVLGCYGDPMIDRMVGLVAMLRRKGVEVVDHFGEGHHGVAYGDPSNEKFFLRIKDFIDI